MRNKALTLLKIIVPILFWLSVWQVAAMLVNNSYFFPTVFATCSELFEILTSLATYKIVALTLLRVILGLILGIVFGCLLAVISNRFSVVRITVSPLISIIKSTPVATFIIILYVIMRGDVLPVFIAFLMVLPLIWQNLIDGYDSIDKNLSEVCDAYGFTYYKRFKILVLPALLKYLIPAVVTASGLAWKAEISAEIIVNTVNSIGKMIYDAQYAFNTSRAFAWTLIIIFMSIILEVLTKRALGRCKR